MNTAKKIQIELETYGCEVDTLRKRLADSDLGAVGLATQLLAKANANLTTVGGSVMELGFALRQAWFYLEEMQREKRIDSMAGAPETPPQSQQPGESWTG
jgi:hypothetical protein